MSEQLLDVAVQEAINDNDLPGDHFLCCADNIAAAKAIIRGDSSRVDPAKTWLYSIVCNERSGVLFWIVLLLHTVALCSLLRLFVPGELHAL
jgi:hypothetical protein